MVDRTETTELVPLQGSFGMTLSESVRKTLIELIIAGRFAEDERLYPEHIAEMFGVSITPVREALMQLATEGFIENILRRGFHIRVPSPEQIRNIWQVRQGLELTAGDLVIERLNDGVIDLEAIDKLDEFQLAQQGDASKIAHATKLELNANLHATIIELSGNELLVSMYRGLQHKVLGGLVQRGMDSWRNRVEQESEEHWAIINALKAKDIAAYNVAVRRHISRSLSDALVDVKNRKT